MTKEKAIAHLENSLSAWYEFYSEATRYISDEDFDAIECLIKECKKDYVDIGRASVVEGEEGNEIFFDDFKRIVGDTFNVGDRLEIKAIKHVDRWSNEDKGTGI